MIPTWSQNDTKMITKSFQNDAKMIPTWCQNYPIIRQDVPKRCQNDPKMIPTWSQNYPRMIPNWVQNDPNMIPILSQNYPKMIPQWSQNDTNMIPKWSQHDPKMISKWFQICFTIALVIERKKLSLEARKKKESPWKSQIDPKIIPTWSHYPNMIPKLSQNDTTRIPKWFQNDSKFCLL